MGKPGFPISQPLVGTAGAPTGGGMGKPGFPISQPLVGTAGAPTGGGMGKPGFPISQPLVGAAGAPHAGTRGTPGSPSPTRWRERLPPHRQGDGETGFPHFATAGGSGWRPHRRGDGETGFPHFATAGGSGWRPHRQGDGETRFPHMFTSAVHAATPHNARMKICVLGRAMPSQTLPSGRGMGKPGFPYVHIIEQGRFACTRGSDHRGRRHVGCSCGGAEALHRLPHIVTEDRLAVRVGEDKPDDDDAAETGDEATQQRNQPEYHPRS